MLTKFSKFIFIGLIALAFCAVNPAISQISGSSCLAANGGSSCTAGDISLSTVTITKVLDGCTDPTDTALVDLEGDVVSASSQRYDVGLWINEDGTSALTGGQCFRDWLPGADGFPELDGDACGTVVKSTSELRAMSSVTIACADLDGDTFAEVSTCVSWKNSGKSNDCLDISGATPGTGSKCQCNITQIDAISIPNLSLTKSCTPDDIVPGGTLSCTIEISNASGAGLATGLHFEDDYPQTYGSIDNLAISSGSATDDGDIIDIQTGDIAAGTTITVTYDFLVNDSGSLPKGDAADSFTNTVDAYYTNVDGVSIKQGLSSSDTTTVPITLGFFSSRLVRSAIGSGLHLEWQTESETANMGFNILAIEPNSGSKFQLNESLVPSKVINSLSATDYQLSVDAPFDGALIIIQDVDVYGNTEDHGPFMIGESVGKRAVANKIDWKRVADDSLYERGGRVLKNKGKKNQASHKSVNEEAPISTLIAVEKSGVQRVYVSSLYAHGVTEKDLETNKLFVSHNAQEIPYWVDEDDKGLFIEFVGESGTTRYSASKYYTLGVDNKSHKYSEVRSTSRKAGYPTFRKTIRAGNDNAYSQFLAGDDPWYDTMLFAISNSSSKEYRLHTPRRVDTDHWPQFSIELAGQVDFLGTVDHHVLVEVNGLEIINERFDGIATKSFTSDFLPEVLVEGGDNVVTVSVTADTPVGIDIVVIKDVAITYTAAIEGETRAKIRGLSDSFVSHEPLRVYRENEQGNWARILPNEVPEGFVFDSNKLSLDSTTHIASESSIVYPIVVSDSSAKKTFSAASHIVLAHPEFITPELINYLEDRKPFVEGDYEVISVFDVYAAHSNYEVSAYAIKSFVQESALHGRLESVLLVGADSYDYKNNLSQDTLSFVPTLYVRTSDVVGQAPTDALITDINSDNVSDFPIGRLMVRTKDQLANTLVKLGLFWNSRDNRSALLVGDKSDQANSIEFHRFIDDYSASLSSKGWLTESVNLDGRDAQTAYQARDSIKRIIEDGIDAENSVSLVLYAGHSSMSWWSQSRLFGLDDARNLQNSDAPFISLQWGCWNSYFVNPDQNTMAQALLTSDIGGAAAVIGASTLLHVEDQNGYARLLHSLLGRNDLSIGEAVVEAKKLFSRESANAMNILAGINILGDPTLTF